MNQEQVLGLVRHILTTLGGVIVAKGMLDESTMLTITGAVTALIGAGWSIYIKRQAA